MAAFKIFEKLNMKKNRVLLFAILICNIFVVIRPVQSVIKIRSYFEEPLKIINQLDSTGRYITRQTYVNINIEGQDVKLLVDTGCTFTLLHHTFEKYLNPEEGRKILRQEQDLFVAQDIQFSKGYSDFNVIEVPHNKEKYKSFYEAKFGRKDQIQFDGILSPQQLLYNGLIILDFDKKRMIGLKGHIKDSMYEKAFSMIDLPKNKFTQHKINKELYDKYALYGIDIDFIDPDSHKKTPFPFLLDTGATGFFVSKKFIEKAGISLTNIRNTEIQTVEEVYQDKSGQGGFFQIGRKQFQNIDIHLDSKLSEDLPEVEGIIGMRNLYNAILIIPSDAKKPLYIGYR